MEKMLINAQGMIIKGTHDLYAPYTLLKILDQSLSKVVGMQNMKNSEMTS